MSTRRRLRAALAPSKRETSTPPARLLAFRLADWIQPGAVPEHVGSDLEQAFAHRAAVARHRWVDAGFAWAREHDLTEREWLTLRRLSQDAR